MPTSNFHFESLIQTMRDSVLVVSPEKEILFYNQAARRLLNSAIKENTAETDNIKYKQIPAEIREMAEQVFFGDLQADGEVLLELKGVKTYLQVHAQLITSIQETSEKNSKAKNLLLVLHDVSRLTKLENIRKEFVANVSHELKTPITSIKAAVETLQDGAVNDKQVMPKFLEMIARQSERLNTIIEDLLSLSRLENEGTEISLAEGSILEVVNQAVSSCDLKARSKNIEIQINAASAIRSRINATLLEQALVNLVDNAIKYSEQGKKITVSLSRIKDEIEISVEDNGYGIDQEHLARLFERFYRVDKARSRTAGGSGLGLSIVKHIAQIHGGKALVESQIGKGSKFSIIIPAS